MYYQTASGPTITSLRQNLNQCALRQPSLGGYHGLTTYALSWSFASVNTGGTTCRLTSVGVVSHTNQLLPTIDTTGASADVKAHWQSIAGQLYTHENQHVALSTNYAQQLYNELTTLTGDSSTIVATGQTMAQAKAAGLQSAQNHLDAVTCHGQY